MAKVKIETRNFVVNCSKEGKSKDFIWFVRHPKINEGKPVMIDRGSLEHYITKKRKMLMDLEGKK